MKPYRVTGKAVQIGQGDKLVLDPAQIASRRAHVKEIKKVAKDAVLVEALTLLTFKVGEVIGLAEVPKHAAEFLVDMGAGPDAQETVKETRVREEKQQRSAASLKKAIAQAKKLYDGSEELKKQFATVDAYLVSVGLAEQKKAA